MQQNLVNSINATGQFSARVLTIATTTESFTNALEKNKLTMGQYFRYAGPQLSVDLEELLLPKSTLLIRLQENE
jgi:hypothetical protein